MAVHLLGGGGCYLRTDGRTKFRNLLKGDFWNRSAGRICELFPQIFHKYILNASQRLHSDRIDRIEYRDFILFMENTNFSERDKLIYIRNLH